MSQHIVETKTRKKKKVTVTMGYDRPLDYVFCTVMDKDGDVIYSNLDDEMAGTEVQDVMYFKPILQKLGIKLPDEVFVEVTNDQLLQVGNRVVHYTPQEQPTWTYRLGATIVSVVKRALKRIVRGTVASQQPSRQPETIGLLDIIGDDTVNEPGYCSGSYWEWEERTARPLLEQLGYSDIRFSMGDHDSFGPLTRIVTASKDGATHRFIYG